METNERTIGSKFVIWLLIIVAAISGVCIGVIALVQHLRNKNEDTSPFIQEGLEMHDEATLFYHPVMGLYFGMDISTELYDELYGNNDKVFVILFAPTAYFDYVNNYDSYKDCDWAEEFRKAGLPFLTMGGSPAPVTNNEGEIVSYKLVQPVAVMNYEQTNLCYSAIGAVRTTNEDGSYSYKYASYPEGLDYNDCSYSLAYVCAKKLNDIALGKDSETAANIVEFNKVINSSVDLANQKPVATEDGSIFEVTISESAIQLNMGEEFQLEVCIAEEIELPIAWTTSDYKVVTIENGLVKAVGEGVAEIRAYIAGQAYSCSIVVGENI